jgi:hypothetical protein
VGSAGVELGSTWTTSRPLDTAAVDASLPVVGL